MTTRPPSFVPARLPRLGASVTLALCITAPLGLYARGAAAQATGAAQPAAGTGRIVGRIVDANSGAGISDVQVRVEGSTLGALSGVDGRFTVTGIPAGATSLQVRRIGFQAKTVSGITVAAGRAVEQNVTLTPATVQLAAVQVTASAERGTVSQALDRQRTATGIISAVTTEQIARSPDSDAAQAVQRVSGVTVQDGRSVFVRGLGERYTTTTLNGARLPSPEPERRYVPLDLFPTGILQTITTTKTFTPELNGDFSGAQVDIQTREFPAQRQISLSLSTGANTLATGRAVLDPRGAGGEAFALSSADRNLPSQLRTGQSLQQLTTRPAINQAVRSLRNVWTPGSRTGRPNSSFGLSVGGQDPLFGRRIGYLASLNYSFSQDALGGYYQSNPNFENGGVTTAEFWRGDVGRSSALWGGMLNLSSLVTTRTRISLNNTYTRSGDNEARESVGPTFYFSGGEGRRSTLRYVERQIRSNQLRGEHEFGPQNVTWSVTSSGVRREEPDRADVLLGRFGAGTGAGAAAGAFRLPESEAEGARRTFGDLRESNWVYQADYRLNLGPEGRQFTVRAGGQYRDTKRDAFNRQFSLLASGLPAEQLAQPVEQIFGGQNLGDNSNVVTLLNAAEDGIYDGTEQLAAGYLMGEVPFGRLRVIAGARIEDDRIVVNTRTSNGRNARAVLDNVDVLPSLVLNYKVSERQNIRASATQTLARPEYRELAPFTYREILGGQNTRGNPDLRRSLIQNYDLRWEFFPNPGEVLSVGAFAKTFDNPIERVDQATGGAPLIVYQNAESARNYGVELEARKQLGGLASFLRPVSGFTNVTLMSSEITIGPGTANTNAERPMVGQAPFVVNAGLTYAPNEGRTSATLLYGVVGKRIFFAGVLPYPDTYERPRNLLDFSLRQQLRQGATVRVDVRNLLDAPYVLETGPIDRERYRLGRTFSVGLSLQR